MQDDSCVYSSTSKKVSCIYIADMKSVWYNDCEYFKTGSCLFWWV